LGKTGNKSVWDDFLQGRETKYESNPLEFLSWSSSSAQSQKSMFWWHLDFNWGILLGLSLKNALEELAGKLEEVGTQRSCKNMKR